MEKHGKKDHTRYLLVIICIIAFVCLAVLYFAVAPPDGAFIGFISSLIPAAIIALVGFPLAYFLFGRFGIKIRDGDNQSLDYDKLSEVIINGIQKHHEDDRGQQFLHSIHERFRTVDWVKLIDESHSQIDIVVYYYDSWVNANYEALVDYFKKMNTIVRIFVADPEDSQVMQNIQRLFPEYSSQDSVRHKVAHTGQRFMRALRDAGGDPSRIEFYYVPHILNYAALCFDSRTIAFSFFEMLRQDRVDSPVILFDLTKSEHLRGFWQKELRGLQNVSRRIEIELE